MAASPHTARLARLILAALLTLGLLLARPVRADQDDRYQVTNLVSDVPGLAMVTDPDLVNPWGMSFSATSPFWISDNGTGLSTLYNGAGVKQRLIVTIPPPAGSPAGTTATPTGQVFNGTKDFAVSANGKSGTPFFLFATEDGTISGWSPAVDGTHAILAVDNSQMDYGGGFVGAVYKGLAMAQVNGQNYLYATNFRAGTVDVFDASFHQILAPGAFRDRRIPRGFAPFNIQNVAGVLVVTYAKQDKARHDDVDGPGLGYVDVYLSNGLLIGRLDHVRQLNAPWGVALAPPAFGRAGNMLLIGNFGDGRINVFDLNGDFRGQLRAQGGGAIVIDGLWALAFGNGAAAGDPNKLYFTAGLDGEQHGLFGAISALPDQDKDGGRQGDRGGDGHRDRD